MLLTTTSHLDGMRIVRYLGVVSGEVIVGANIFRDFFASVRDIVGGRAGAYEKELRKAKEIAMNEMIEKAKEMGANAIIGIDVEYETLVGGGKSGMLMVSVTGTAVVVA